MWAKVHTGCHWPIETKDGGYYCNSCDAKVSLSQVEDGFKKSRFLYGEHLAKEGGTAVLVEGIVDALKVYQATCSWKKGEYFPLGLLGSSVSIEQAQKIIRFAGNR